MSCCELVDRPLKKASERHRPTFGNSNESPVYSGWDINKHIGAYTQRALTHQSDVLRAMQGLFNFFASTNRNDFDRRLQHWGISINPRAYWTYGQDMPSSDDQPRLALSQGLYWEVASDLFSQSRTTRRHGFPSWSWSGWVAPVQWSTDPRFRSPRYQDALRGVSLQKHNGARIPFTGTLAAQLHDRGHEDTSFTYYLCLEAEILEVKVTYLKGGMACRNWTYGPGILSKYVVAASVDAMKSSKGLSCDQVRGPPGPKPRQRHFWPIIITPHVEEDDAIHKRLCQEVLRCMVLPDSWGLVIWAAGSAFERVGLMRLHGMSGGNWVVDLDGPHLRDYFPGSVQDIVLG